MKTMQEVRQDLNEIRYYYSKQKLFDSTAQSVVGNAVLEKVQRYNRAMKNAPPRLYDVYISLYIQNNTQAALAYDWDFTPDYIKQLNRQLCEYLVTVFGRNG